MLVPGPAIVGAFDGQLRDEIRGLLRERPLLRGLIPKGVLLSRERAVVLETNDGVVSGAMAALLADVVDGVVDPAWCWSQDTMTLIEPMRMRLAEVLEMLISAQRPPAWWRLFYETVSDLDSGALEGLPVPLVDGRVVRDVRSCFLPTDLTESIASLELRIIAPDAVHPLLERLGARPGDAYSVLSSDELHQRLREERPQVESQRFSKAVLELVALADPEPTDISQLRQMQVPVQDDQSVELGEAVVPGSVLSSVVASDAWVIDPAFASEVGTRALELAGGMADFVVERHHDVLLDPDDVDLLIPDGRGWVEYVAGLLNDSDPASCLVPELDVVVGLDVVADDAWPRAWPLLSRPQVRDAIVLRRR